MPQFEIWVEHIVKRRVLFQVSAADQDAAESRALDRAETYDFTQNSIDSVTAQVVDTETKVAKKVRRISPYR
jgi:hypothetical protein